MTILELVGLAVIAAGFALIWLPLGVIAAGLGLFAVGFVGLDDDDEEPKA